MEKLWANFEEKREVGQDFDIMKTIFFSPYTNLGEIRKEFNSWSIDELISLSTEVYFTETEDLYREFGIMDQQSYTAFSECVASIEMPSHIWSTCNKKKKFF